MSKVDFSSVHKKLFQLVLQMHSRENLKRVRDTSEFKLWQSILVENFNATDLYLHYKSYCYVMGFIPKCTYFTYKDLTKKGRECLTHETCDSCDYKFGCAFDLDVHNDVPVA